MDRGSALDTVARASPNWQRWISLLRVPLAESERPEWAAMVPDAGAAEAPVAEGDCLLAGARIAMPARAVERLTRTLLETAGAPLVGRPSRALLGRLLEAALDAQDDALPSLAVDLGVPAEALRAIAPLLAMPLLMACQRRWASRISPSWPHGYCPVCAAWPVLAEARGLERSRQLRCGRCGSDWRFDWLRCPFCGCGDHDRLGSLVPSRDDARRVEVCHACGGYVKTLTTLSGTPARDMTARDLDTVELDLVALERGFARPHGLARGIGARIAPRALRGLARWTAR